MNTYNIIERRRARRMVNIFECSGSAEPRSGRCLEAGGLRWMESRLWRCYGDFREEWRARRISHVVFLEETLRQLGQYSHLMLGTLKIFSQRGSFFVKVCCVKYLIPRFILNNFFYILNGIKHQTF